MNKKNLTLIGAVSLLICNGLLFKIFLDKKLNLIEVPIAAVQIEPRQKITEDMIVIKKIPSVAVQENTVLNQEDIIGLYTEIEGIIPKGSYFYESMLFEEEALPDYPALKLKENQNVFSLSTDLIKSSGNTLTNNQLVDLHVTIEQKKEAPVTDCLLSSVRVLNVKDRKGNDMKESSGKVPYVINLAVDQDYVKLLQMAKQIGSIELYATSLSSEEECVLNEESKILEYLKNE